MRRTNFSLYYQISCCRANYIFKRLSIYNFYPSITAMDELRLANDASENVRQNSTEANIKYEEAVKALNGLQSNAALLDEIKKQRKENPIQNMVLVQKYLEKVGVKLTDLDELPVIHVAGTKGKGSTCAFVESILREHGLKTGFYSSPHLVAVRERIRINGMPISKTLFSQYFGAVYGDLEQKKENPNDMPGYFRFLTILAFKIFLKEEVDVAVVEVGIGGEYDCTNIIRSPVACGITSLDFDHTLLLGDTIEEIAWHKAGIMKSCAPTFTVSQQPPSAMQMLKQRMEEKQTELYVSPPLEKYGWQNRPIHLGLSGYVQFLNASLALQLSRYFVNKRGHLTLPNFKDSGKVDEFCGLPFVLSEEEILGLENVVWPGRLQVLDRDRNTFFIDGAHTPASMQNCVDWFNNVSAIHVPKNRDGTVCKVLLFNITGDRDFKNILQKLFLCNFDVVIFTTNLATKEKNAASDQTNFTVSDARQIANTKLFQKYWLHLFSESRKESESTGFVPQEAAQACLTTQCISDALQLISTQDYLCAAEAPQESTLVLLNKFRNASHVQVMVTGSLHLVGGVLSLLDPSLSQDLDSIEIPSMADMVKRNYTNSHHSTPGAP